MNSKTKRRCQKCDHEFESGRKLQKFCSKTCCEKYFLISNKAKLSEYRKNWMRRNRNKDYDKAYNAKPENKARNARKSRLRTYGPNAVAHFDSQLELQRGRCALCSAVMQRPHQDHCHKTGQLRSLLCAKCNSGLGHIERQGFVERARAYLAEWVLRREAAQ